MPRTSTSELNAQNPATKLAPPPPKLSANGNKRGANKAHPVTKGVRTQNYTNSKAQAALIDENKPLTPQQLIFVRAWASGESINTASARAGYNDSASYAHRMTVMPNILKVYHAEKVKYEAACDMSRKRVMDGLLEAVEMAKLMAEPSTMVSGWREIGKMCGYYEPTKIQVDVNVAHDVTVRQLNGMSDAELLKLIKTGATPAALPLLETSDEVDE